MIKIYKYAQPVLIIALIAGCFFLWDKAEIQTSRIDTLNKTLYDVAAHKKEIYIEIQKNQFKEDYYLNQLSNNTTIIMTMITLIVGLSGYFSLKFFDKKENEIDNKLLEFNKIEEKISNSELELKKRLELRNLEYYQNNIELHSILADLYIDREYADYSKGIKHHLLSLLYNLKCKIYNEKNYPSKNNYSNLDLLNYLNILTKYQREIIDNYKANQEHIGSIIKATNELSYLLEQQDDCLDNILKLLLNTKSKATNQI